MKVESKSRSQDNRLAVREETVKLEFALREERRAEKVSAVRVEWPREDYQYHPGTWT